MQRAGTHNRAIVWIFAAAAAMILTAVTSSAATHYVSQTSPSPTPPYSTPETAARNIQDAIDAANDGDTVSVAPDQYNLTNQITVTKAIVLQAPSGPNQTFLNNTNVSWTLWVSNSLAVADGFTLQNPLVPSSKEPRGAFLVGGTIQNCNFTNFGLVEPGAVVSMTGGILSNSIACYTRRFESAAVACTNGLITDCQVIGADRGGPDGSGVYLQNSRLQNSVIRGAATFNSSGPAVYALSSTVVACTISNNISLDHGGGAYLQDSFMDRCIITGNTGGGECLGSGGGGIFETNSVIRNSLIISNNLTFGSGDPSCGNYGGGVYMQGGSLVNCTIAGNSARVLANGSGGGGGIFAESGDIYNSIIYFNYAGAGSSNWLNTGGITIYNSCSVPDPNEVGPGNITDDPQFVDMTNGNYHLSPGSPCIATGVVQPWMTGAQDLDGNPRTTNGRVDIGAYQSGYPPLTTKLSIFRSGSNVVVQWKSGQPFNLVLESSSDLAAPQSWTPVQATIYSNGTNAFVTLPATNKVRFFRRR